jgi:hypothetical protein
MRNASRPRFQGSAKLGRPEMLDMIDSLRWTCVRLNATTRQGLLPWSESG